MADDVDNVEEQTVFLKHLNILMNAREFYFWEKQKSPCSILNGYFYHISSVHEGI